MRPASMGASSGMPSSSCAAVAGASAPFLGWLIAQLRGMLTIVMRRSENRREGESPRERLGKGGGEKNSKKEEESVLSRSLR
jgi:hypothetical protein